MKEIKSVKVESLEAMDELAQEYALLAVQGMGINACVDKLKKEYFAIEVTRTKLQRLKNHPRYIETMESNMKTKIRDGITISKIAIAENPIVFVKCLYNAAEEGGPTGIKASDIALRLLYDKEEAKTEQNQAINIVLATDVPKKPL